MTPLRSSVLLLAAGAAAVLLTGCAAATPGTAAPTPTSAAEGDGHGAISGAVEVAEPPLQLVAVDDAGTVGILDLLDGTAAPLDAIGAPHAVATDGRYVFATTDAGVEIVDSGVWTWDHVDHFHYYRATPAVLGAVEGAGPAVVATGPLSTAGATGVFFSGSGEAVLLDNAALADGAIVELFRLETGAASGVVAPIDDGAVVATDDRVRVVTSNGADTGAETSCPDPSGSITTRVGLVIGCADGAVLATEADGEVVFEDIPLPEGMERPTSFDGRKGRPTVAGLLPGTGYALLDTRERTWQVVETDPDLVRVSAVDDADGHVVALDASGRVRVYVDGAEIAATEPLVDVLDEGVSLTVDAQRAYVNAPGAGVVHEIAYADGARVARSLETPVAPDFVAEVGR
ncbi:ABC transporter [Microbacterium sp. NPDC055683]